MTEFDPETIAEHAVMLGLVSNEQAFQAKVDAGDESADAVLRSMLRKGMLTSWQVERLQKGDPSGFFFGNCKVLFHLAEGTFARVYRGVRQTDNQPVAIKVLRQRFVTEPAAIARFNKEAEAGMRLQHPNIVQILDFGEQDRRYYMIMEYVEGLNLRDFMKIRNRFEPKAALPLIIGLSRGLKYSTDRGVTHRDIKGTNILIGNNGSAKLVDFGLATIESDDERMAALNQRTVNYSALERTCSSPKGDPRSDIYFLGCVFYQMLTGQVAMKEVESSDMLQKMLKRSFGAIKPLSEHRLAPDPELTRIIEKMMKIDLKERYQTMDDVVKDLEAYEASLKIPSHAVQAAPKDALDDHDQIFLPFEQVIESEVAHAEEPAVKHSTKQVLCVETQAEIQDAFRKFLSKMGFRVFLVSDAERAAERYRESPPDAVIFDVDGIGEEGIEAFIDMHDKAHTDGHELVAVVLLGPKQHALKEKLPTNDRLIVLGKPVKMKQVQDAITELLPVG